MALEARKTERLDKNIDREHRREERWLFERRRGRSSGREHEYTRPVSVHQLPFSPPFLTLSFSSFLSFLFLSLPLFSFCRSSLRLIQSRDVMELPTGTGREFDLSPRENARFRPVRGVKRGRGFERETLG